MIFLCIVLSIFFYVYFYYFMMDFCLWNVFFMDYEFVVNVFFFCQICLILAEATAIGVRLSHASRTIFFRGIRLSNTWITYP